MREVDTEAAGASPMVAVITHRAMGDTIREVWGRPIRVGAIGTSAQEIVTGRTSKQMLRRRLAPICTKRCKDELQLMWH